MKGNLGCQVDDTLSARQPLASDGNKRVHVLTHMV